MTLPDRNKWADRVDRLASEFEQLPRNARIAFLRRSAGSLPVKFLLGEECRRLRQDRLDYPNGEIYLRLSSDAELIRLRSCAKEPWTVEWIEQSIADGDVLYDIGANVGAYSLVAAVRGRARIFAFEPGYASFAALCDNIVLNNFQELITPLPIALAAETRMAHFNYRDVRSGAAVHLLEGALPRVRFEPQYRQPMPSYRLDDVVATFELPAPTHLKLDVDGIELAVLQGAKLTLADRRLRSILIEVNKYEGQICRLFERHGFAMVRRVEKQNAEGEVMSTWYGIFER